MTPAPTTTPATTTAAGTAAAATIRRASTSHANPVPGPLRLRGPGRRRGCDGCRERQLAGPGGLDDHGFAWRRARPDHRDDHVDEHDPPRGPGGPPPA